MVSNEFKTPADLYDELYYGEDAETALKVYTEASAFEKEYADIKDKAEAIANASLPKGERINIGVASAGWTRPKMRWVLDQDAWDKACQENGDLSDLETNFQAAKKALEKAEHALTRAQKDYQKEETPSSRFFIKINPQTKK